MKTRVLRISLDIQLNKNTLYIKIVKSKLFNLALVVTSLIVYLEWGGDNSAFLFQSEIEILTKFINNPASVSHPFITIPLVGQIVLFYTLFQKKPSKIFTYIGIVSLGFLIYFVLLIGIFGVNYKVIASTLPFVTFSVLTIRNYRKQKTKP